jgi:hypothetical protein
MSSTNPPNPNVSTFNNLYWSITDIPLTQSQADRRYLKYPVAQGKETLQDIDVNGVANFNQPLTMTSATAANRTITTTNLNINNTSNTAVGIISGSTNSIFYDNNAISGTHNFYASDAGGTQTNPLNISSSSINANRPLVLAGGSSADRTVTTTNINVTNATNTAVGTISGSGDYMIYDNNASAGGFHQFKLQSGGIERTILELSPSQLTATKQILMSSNTSTDRNILTTTLTLLNTDNSLVAPPIGNIKCQVGNTNIGYENFNNNGSHNFLTRDNLGNITTPITINSNGLIMNVSGDYIQFPDGTQQTTAFTSSGIKTYTEYIPAATPNLPSKTVTIPAGCYAIDIMAISGGGQAGTNDGSVFNGGSGGGGQVVKSNSKIAVSPGQQIIVYFATSVGGTFIRGANAPNNSVLIRSAGADELAPVVSASIQVNGVSTSFTDVIGTMKNGLDGGNGTTIAHGTGAPAGSDLPAFTPVACSWVAYRTTAGKAGNFNTGGRPTGAKWLLQGYGMGGISTNMAPSTQAGIALVMITYYLS